LFGCVPTPAHPMLTVSPAANVYVLSVTKILELAVNCLNRVPFLYKLYCVVFVPADVTNVKYANLLARGTRDKTVGTVGSAPRAVSAGAFAFKILGFALASPP